MTAAHGPRSGPRVHLSAEDLSALAEGSQPSAEGASEHLGHCVTCQAELDALNQLLDALETMERPALPPEVTLRIDAALAREAAAWSAHAPKAQDAAARAESPTRARRRLPFSRGFGWGLASLAVTAGGVLLAVNLSSSTNSGSGASASGSAAGPEASLRNNAARQSGGLAGSPEQLTPATPLAQWVRQALADRMPHTRINSPCLSDPGFSGGEPLAVVNGSYDGVPAVLVIYSNDGDSSTVRAVAYALPCAAQNYQVLAQGVVAK